MNKKLIEVAMPLEKINVSAAYEKMPGIGAHPRGLHLWWARRPFVAARAVLWASLVDDPSSHPELFPNEEEQVKERNRLFEILVRLADWKNSDDQSLFEEAKAEILKWTNNNPPAVLDPFAGGGAIPLEATRLGLAAYAHDLNPVAVVINKAMIEIPAAFKDTQPVNPDSNNVGKAAGYVGIGGLVADIQYYGRRVNKQATAKLSPIYPKLRLQNGGKTDVVAWIWSRTVQCPNPACHCVSPLIKSYDLATKKSKAKHIEPMFENNKVSFVVKDGKSPVSGTVSRKGATCIQCGTPISFDYIRAEGRNKRLDNLLIAVVGDGKNGRLYLPADEEQKIAASVHRPEDYPDAEQSVTSRTPVYGLTNYSDIFTNRQLTALTTFSDLVIEIQSEIESDAISAGMPNDHIGLKDGGNGARAYAEAIVVYLSFAVDRLADFSTSVSRWAASNEKAMNCFSKQRIAMTWDYPEVNVLGDSVGSYKTILDYIIECIKKLPCIETRAIAQQADAQIDCKLRNVLVSTDPPYYDNIEYADCSDFFYIWMRRVLRKIYPDLFPTMLTPKKEELVATPYKFNGNMEEAKAFFEGGMLETCRNIYKYTDPAYPVTIYYAYKQSETEDVGEESNTASSGWETMLSAIVQAGLSITGTWPMRTEQEYRTVSMGTNALASSIVLVCRKRSADAPVCTRRNFINELKRELRPALKKLQSSNIAPVDLAQSAIGPGMGVYSKYAQVLEADGTPMSVRSALKVINQELDLYFNEQDGELDSESRFCVDLYSQVAFNEMKFGDANTLATAKNTSVAIMASHGTLYAQKGVVHLIERSGLPEKIHEHEESIWLLCQQLTYQMEKGGVEGCAKAIANMFGTNAERAKDLAYRLYTIAERKHWAQEAYAYNALVVAWPEIQSRAAELKAQIPQQLSLFDNIGKE